MSPTREERHAAIRAEQQKVASGTGFPAWMDRTAWAMSSRRGGGP